MIITTNLISRLIVSMVIGVGSSATHARADDNYQFPNDVPQFEEQAVEGGMVHRYEGPWEFFVGGGVASFDCNGDRMPDVFLAGGTTPAQLYVNSSKVGGKLVFIPKPVAVAAKDLEKVLGVYPVNVDNDGYTDLVVLRLGENLLLKGGPDCSFEKANKLYSFDGGREWSTAFSAIFEAGNKFPTLAVGNYVDRSAPGSPWGTCHNNFLFRPKSTEEAFPDYSEPALLQPGYCALSMLFTDWNQSGEAALRITNDRQYYRDGEEQLWQVSPGKAPRQYTTSQGWRRLNIWGMGIAAADIDNDGRPEYALTSMGDTMLQTLDKEGDDDFPIYRDMSYDKGTTAHRPYTGTDLKPSTGWHSQFADFNNDTRLDLFIAKGNVEAMPDFAAYDPDNLLLGGIDGKFHEKGDVAGIALDRRGRGAVVEDFNADGMLDLLVVNRSENVSLFRNLGAASEWGHKPMGNWAAIELNNGKINPQAIGARITIKTGILNQTRTIAIGGGHASGQVGFQHIGLGVAERATVRVQWPDGEWSHEYRIFANQFVIIERDSTDVKYWYPVAN
jgi:hypothetical protein